MKIIERAESPKTLKTLNTPTSRFAGGVRRSGTGKASITMRALLEWVYSEQRPHRGGGGAGAIGYAATSQTGAVIERLRLGCQVSGGGGLRRSHCDGDALSVHRYVMMLDGNERALMIRWAELRMVPDWSPRMMPYRCVPVPGRRGRPYKGIYDRSGNEIGCQIDYEGVSPCTANYRMQYARDVYGLWYSVLAVLADAIAAVDELRRYVVVGIGAQREPWVKDAKKCEIAA